MNGETLVESRSLLLRGAWIEILRCRTCSVGSMVAPLAGSVDRNVYGPDGRDVVQVAPLPGSVDRNGKLLPWEKFLADLRTFPAVARSGSFGLP